MLNRVKGLVLLGALALAGCNTMGQPGMNAAMPRGSSVAFESIDGPPPEIFRKLVSNLNDEAQSRSVAVMPRDGAPAYRVRGYLAVRSERSKKGNTVLAWVWDVYDADQARALRISGEEVVRGKPSSAWSVADDATLRKIARNSMDQLAGFLNAGAPAPAGVIFTSDATPAAAPSLALAQTQE